ncbi:hypothetical protein ACFQ0B_78585 [Nonomuraea thailandensis]
MRDHDVLGRMTAHVRGHGLPKRLAAQEGLSRKVTTSRSAAEMPSRRRRSPSV